MWLIEFVDGHLKGVTLPLDGTLEITGNKQQPNLEALVVPEMLPNDMTLSIELKGMVPILRGTCQRDKIKRLIANHVYRVKGLNFFVYKEGARRPRLKRFRLRQYSPLLVGGLLLNMMMTWSVMMLLDSQQQTRFVDYLRQIGVGYLKEGKLYIYDSNALDGLPEDWQENIHILPSNDYLRASQLSLEIVSSSSGKPLDVTLVHQQGRDQIRVKTQEQDLKVMKLFGQYGLEFEKHGEDWLVSNRAIAAQLLTEANLKQVIERLKAPENEDEIIDEKSFPYFIFYSSKAGSYIYDANERYWQGSEVPNLGIIVSISPHKIVFKDGIKTRVYLIKLK